LDTSAIDITICSVAYRDKRIVETVSQAVKLADSPQSLSLALLIQDSYHHDIISEPKIKHKNIQYRPWCDFDGFAAHRQELVRSVNSESYILFVNPGTEFVQSWDTQISKLIEANPNSAISLDNDVFSLSGTIIKKGLLAKIHYPDYLKSFGEEEVLSISLFCAEVPIRSGMLSILKPEQLKDWDYVPFSLSHNYHEAVSLYTSGENSYTHLRDNYKEYADRCPLKTIMHQINDVDYRMRDTAVAISPYDVFHGKVGKL
jgi:hypothetical protein